jgi:hypothetical protein
MAGKLAGCGDPGLADDREAHLYDGPGSTQPRKPHGRIAQIVLARKIDARQWHQLLSAEAKRWGLVFRSSTSAGGVNV